MQPVSEQPTTTANPEVFAAMFVIVDDSAKALLHTLHEIEALQSVWRTHRSHSESYKELKQAVAVNHNATGEKYALGQARLLNALSFDLAQLTATIGCKS